MATVKLEHIYKIYEGGVEAVSDFNLVIDDKEFVVLVGPSGCGKSTTLRMIAGLEDISKGEMYIDDTLVNNIEPKNRDIAMVFQSYALYPHMTVYDNMAFALKLRHMPKDEIDRRVREAAEILGITEYLSRKPKALSGGQRQRVAIGRAIVREPKVFLMDEPLSNLDAKLRNQMRAEIIKLRKRINTTFVYVTHDQTEAMTLGDRIVIMEKGLIQQIGTPQEVFYHPVNKFVAGFIGSPQMNFLNGKLVKKDGGFLLQIKGEGDAAAAEIVLDDEKIAKLKEKEIPDEKDVIVGIRPEHIEVTVNDEPKTLKGIVEVSEMMGSELHLHVNAVGKDVVLRVQVIDLPEEFKNGIPYGTEVRFNVLPDYLHIFDPETEQSLLI